MNALIYFNIGCFFCGLFRLFLRLFLPHRDEFVHGHVYLLLDVRHGGASAAANQSVTLYAARREIWAESARAVTS